MLARGGRRAGTRCSALGSVDFSERLLGWLRRVLSSRNSTVREVGGNSLAVGEGGAPIGGLVASSGRQAVNHLTESERFRFDSTHAEPSSWAWTELDGAEEQ